MVNLNFTLFVELVLFLLFLWGTNRFILRPTLKTIDEREALVKHNEEATALDAEEAEELEQRYAAQLNHLYRESEERVRAARRKAMNAHTERVQLQMKQADTEIAEFRSAVQARVDEQSGEVHGLAPELAETIDAHLRGGARS